MATCEDLDYCLIIRSDSIHRIQETQDAVALAIWERVQAKLGGEGGP